MSLLKQILIIIFIISYTSLLGQKYATIYGKITDKKNQPVPYVNITVDGTIHGTSSNDYGNFELKIPAERNINITISSVGYNPKHIQYKAKTDTRSELNVSIDISLHNIQEISVEDKRDRSNTLIRIDPKTIYLLPTATGGIESILKTFPGVSSNNELSSQYTVRGGNFDENLVYVNDIEVYRPFLVRSGQQEGLSFVNTDMVSSIQFSSGGFEAKYGDKMSSVLDIKYRKPTKTGANITASMLGGSVSFEGCSDDYRFTHITGVRYKTNQWVLRTMETKGDYKPSFLDAQTFLNYQITDRFELSFLGNVSQNKYMFVPVNRETSFGTINQALKLKIYFDGQEVDKYLTGMGALSANYNVNKDFNFKVFTSVYKDREQETFDIQGQYFLNELDRDIGSDNLGDSLMNIGIGTFLNHARNYLEATVINTGIRGNLNMDNNIIVWGANVQHEIINDKINEWEMRDSAGYSLPYTDSIVSMAQATNAENNITSNRINLFIQDSYSLNFDSATINFTGGIRGTYWDFNDNINISPRISVAFIPKWRSDILFRFASGFYYQPPFYKELRNDNGDINYNIKSQKSIHYVLGMDYNFLMLNRKFKLVSELYYKQLSNIIPYTVDNVRVRYSAKNDAKGYAVGADMKLFGEVVPGVDSWASLSIMQTKEYLSDDTYFITDTAGHTTAVKPGYMPRPSDQLINFGMFFQDYLPMNPKFKAQLSFLFGTGLPFWPPNTPRYKAPDLRMPSYLRFDFGVSYVLKSENEVLSENNLFKNFKSIWITFEVFNILGANNVISYLWITDIYNKQYAIPNYLTPRTLNLKIIAKI